LTYAFVAAYTARLGKFGAQLIRSSEIDRHDVDVDVVHGLQAGGQSLKPIAAARDDDEIVLIAREPLGKGGADA
jgi:hypothetical protein